MLGHALVHAFIAAAEKDDAIERGITAGRFLIEKFAGSGHEKDGCLRIGVRSLGGIADAATEERFDGFKERLGLEDHALAPAEGTVGHSAVTVVGEFAEIVHADFEPTVFAG